MRSHPRPASRGRFRRFPPHHTNDMNRWIVFLFMATLFTSAPASASMLRAAGAADRQTILLEGGGTLRLRGVDLPADEEPAAREYLQRLVGGLWIYVENGDVYRSPDALFINGEMARRAWKSGPKMTYLGPSFPTPPRRTAARTATPRARSIGHPNRAPRRTTHAARRAPAHRTVRPAPAGPQRYTKRGAVTRSRRAR